MAKFLSNRDGGSLDELGIYQFLDKLFTGEVITGLNVTQMDTPGLGVEVQLGTAMIPSGSNYPYVVFADASENVTLATADGSNPRIDLIVGYVDLTVVDDTNPNNPGAFLLENITGTPSGSPAVPNAAAIQAVIGASNPYIILARVAVAASASTITNANVTDVRVMATITPAKWTNQYKFSVYRNAALNSSNSFTKVAFDAELYDSNNNFDSATNYRYTAPVAGFYNFSALAGNTAAGSTAIHTKLYKNGSAIKDGSYAGNGTTGGAYSHVSGDLKLVAGDYIEVFFIGGAGSTMAVGQASCYFDGHLVSQT